MKTNITKLLKENRTFLLFVVLMLAFRNAYADWNTVPTASMQPTIVEGDRITVNKLAYDIRLPFINMPIYSHANPERGDIVVFNSKAADIRLVKRIIGTPGDTIQLANNQLIINGKAVEYSLDKKQRVSYDLIESLPNVKHKIRVLGANTRFSSFPETKIPEGQYLVLGDNRDNSADSRAIGLVPRKEIIGKSTHVVMSFNYDNYYIPRKNRFFRRLDD